MKQRMNKTESKEEEKENTNIKHNIDNAFNCGAIKIENMENKKIIKNRSEILFLYDITDNNPNGDPLEENRPRIDRETGINIVTDVRFKRTIRDYLYDYRDQEIFIRDVRKNDGKLKTKEDRLTDLKINSKYDLLVTCIDMRTFGCTIAIEKKTITFTGPIQFKYGRSLHKVSNKYFKGTTVMPSDEGLGQGTFTADYKLPYSLIKFYGIINENVAKDTMLSEEDIELLLDGIWNGTKNLITRSKIGQVPRLLLKINYKEKNYHIGDIDNYNMIKISSNLSDEDIRDISQIKLDITGLIDKLSKYNDKIENIEFKIDDQARFIYNKEEKIFEDCLAKVQVPTKTMNLKD